MENAFLHVVFSLLGVVFFYWLFKNMSSGNQQVDEEDSTDEEEMAHQEERPVTIVEKTEEKPHTRKLVLETLRKMGCEFSDKEEGLICFTYQGGGFAIEALDDCFFINVNYPWLHVLPMDGDLEDFACMQKAVNMANHHDHCNVFYTFDKEENQICVHSKKNILFISQIPHIESYLASTLDAFFRIRREVLIEMEKNRIKEEQL